MSLVTAYFLVFTCIVSQLSFAAGADAGGKDRVYLKGGFLTLPGAGTIFPKRQTYIRPFSIDVQAREVWDGCAGKDARLPSAAELQYALLSKKVKSSGRAEITYSSINPVDAEETSDLEGVGSYDVAVDTSGGFVVSLPSFEQGGENKTRVGRCLYIKEEPSKKDRWTLTCDVSPRYGADENWPEVSGFYALKEGTKKLVFSKGQEFELLYKKGDWALVRSYKAAVMEFPDSGVWVPAAALVKAGKTWEAGK